MDTSDKINPMLVEFLDCKTNAQKIRVLNKYKHEWTLELLTVLEGAMELVAADDKDTEAHFRNLLKVLEMKKKYEEPGMR